MKNDEIETAEARDFRCFVDYYLDEDGLVLFCHRCRQRQRQRHGVECALALAHTQQWLAFINASPQRWPRII